jgi:two-component system sensor histidine kinase UhpB
VQEALTNIVRHASATAVRIRLLVADGQLAVEVHDDGAGARVTRAGVGLVGMRERAEMAGGHFRFESRPDAGCSVYMTLPLLDSSRGHT